MKVLLIQLYSGKEIEPIYPLGLSYLANALSAHDVKIFDQNICNNDPFLETEKTVLEFSPEVVGISVRNIRLYSRKTGQNLFQEQLKSTIKAIKKANHKAIIVAGGSGFSIFAHRFMKHEPGIDLGIFLEGEESFPALLENINFPEKVNGVFWRNKGEIRFTGSYVPPKFELSPQPRRDIIDPQKYKGGYAIGIQAKRGCLLKCLYCSYPFLSGNTLRLRPAERVLDEIEDLVNNYGMREFTFVDNVFNIPIEYAEEICNGIINRNIQVSWSAWFNEMFMEEKFVDLTIRAGCRMFEFSPDGYSNHSLNWLNKNIETKHIINTYRLARKKPEIKVSYNFMVGIPGQDIFSLARQALFFLKLKVFLRRGLGTLIFHKLGIDPNTELERIALKEGVITPETDLFNPTFYQVGILRWLNKHKRLRLALKLFRDKTLHQKSR